MRKMTLIQWKIDMNCNRADCCTYNFIVFLLISDSNLREKRRRELGVGRGERKERKKEGRLEGREGGRER